MKRSQLSRMASITLATASLLAPLLVGTSAGATGPSARALLNTALRNATAGKWVHEVAHANLGSALKLTMTNDIGTYSGRQVVSFSDGARAEIIAFEGSGVAYAYANYLGWGQYFGLTPAQATQYAGQWLIITPDNPEYTNIVSGTWLKSDFTASSIGFVGALSLGAGGVKAGVHVTVIKGAVPASGGLPKGTAQFYVSVAKPIRPVELTYAIGSVSSSVVWSRWGKPVTLRPPGASLPWPSTTTTTTIPSTTTTTTPVTTTTQATTTTS